MRERGPLVPCGPRGAALTLLVRAGRSWRRTPAPGHRGRGRSCAAAAGGLPGKLTGRFVCVRHRQCCRCAGPAPPRQWLWRSPGAGGGGRSLWAGPFLLPAESCPAQRSAGAAGVPLLSGCLAFLCLQWGFGVMAPFLANRQFFWLFDAPDPFYAINVTA